MSIKPIDLQTMIPKIPEVSRISNASVEKNAAFQQQQASNTHSQVEANMTGVYARERAQEGKIREKQEKSQGKEKDKQRKNKSRKTKLQAQKNATSTIDIKL